MTGVIRASSLWERSFSLICFLSLITSKLLSILAFKSTPFLLAVVLQAFVLYIFIDAIVPYRDALVNRFVFLVAFNEDIVEVAEVCVAEIPIRYLGRCLLLVLFVCHLVPHNFKIIAHFRLQVNPFLIIIFVESPLGRPILKALGYLDHFDHVLMLVGHVNLLLIELFDHFLSSCL